MLDLEILVPPSAEPVSLAEAKAWLRLGTDGDDTVLSRMIVAARARFENETGRALMARTVRERFVPLPQPNRDGLVWLLPANGPATAITAVTMIDGQGIETPAPAGFCTLAGRQFKVVRSVPGMVVTYSAGASDIADVALADRVAVLEILAGLYARRNEGQISPRQQEPRI
jgi:uncharacterized phiE125 gp8 family phage protein